MKKLITLFSVFALCFSLTAKPSGEEIHEKLKKSNKQSFSMSFSKSMLDFFDMDLDFNGKEKLITGDFFEGKMLVLEEVKSVQSICSLFKKENYRLVESDEIKKEENGGEVYLFIDHKGKNISEAHFVIADESKVTILSVFGDIKVKNK